jgi:hypothetical protein
LQERHHQHQHGQTVKTTRTMKFAAVDWLLVLAMASLEPRARVDHDRHHQHHSTAEETCHQRRLDCVRESFDVPLQSLPRAAWYFDNLDICIVVRTLWTMQSIDNTASNTYRIEHERILDERERLCVRVDVIRRQRDHSFTSLQCW